MGIVKTLTLQWELSWDLVIINNIINSIKNEENNNNYITLPQKAKKKYHTNAFLESSHNKLL